MVQAKQAVCCDLNHGTKETTDVFWGALKGLLAPYLSGSFHAYPEEASIEEWDPPSCSSTAFTGTLERCRREMEICFR